MTTDRIDTPDSKSADGADHLSAAPKGSHSGGSSTHTVPNDFGEMSVAGVPEDKKYKPAWNRSKFTQATGLPPVHRAAGHVIRGGAEAVGHAVRAPFTKDPKQQLRVGGKKVARGATRAAEELAAHSPITDDERKKRNRILAGTTTLLAGAVASVAAWTSKTPQPSSQEALDTPRGAVVTTDTGLPSLDNPRGTAYEEPVRAEARSYSNSELTAPEDIVDLQKKTYPPGLQKIKGGEVCNIYVKPSEFYISPLDPDSDISGLRRIEYDIVQNKMIPADGENTDAALPPNVVQVYRQNNENTALSSKVKRINVIFEHDPNPILDIFAGNHFVYCSQNPDENSIALRTYSLTKKLIIGMQEISKLVGEQSLDAKELNARIHELTLENLHNISRQMGIINGEKEDFGADGLKQGLVYLDNSVSAKIDALTALHRMLRSYQKREYSTADNSPIDWQAVSANPNSYPPLKDSLDINRRGVEMAMDLGLSTIPALTTSSRARY